MIRLYGHLAGSFRTVTKGFEEGLTELGLLAGSVHSSDMYGQEPAGGATAPVAVVVGDPLRALNTHIWGNHQKCWLMLAPNSEGIPASLRNTLLKDMFSPLKKQRARTVDGFLAPSEWAKGVLEREFPDHPVVLCPHGILSDFQFDLDLSARRLRLPYRALHVTSTKFSRKGTRELVGAWMRVGRGVLDILANPEYLGLTKKLVTDAGAEKLVRVVAGQHIPYAQYVQSLHLYSEVIQPSRAEGFGLVPLEARACGVPVVMTNNSGHAQHFDASSCQLVESGPNGDSDDYWGATAPTVTTESIEQALVQAKEQWWERRLAARDFARSREHWSWANQIKAAMQEIVKDV